MNAPISFINGAILTLLIIAYLELTRKRTAYVGTDSSMTGFFNYFLRGTDDTITIQKAINYINRIGGGVVFLNEGTYTVGTIELLNNVLLRGEGESVAPPPQSLQGSVKT